MSVYRFRDNTYLQFKKYWFVWESAWDGYRPVDALRWNGTTYEVLDTQYIKDPLDRMYGYGSESMKKLCDILTERYPKEKAKIVSHLTFGIQEWFRDRMLCMSPCAPKDLPSWKRMVAGRRRTCRRGPANKFTHRTLIK